METVKVKKYLERIGMELPENVVPDSAFLRELQFAHCTHIPYENLDIIRGIPLSLDEDDLFRKVVEERKGGFCFELNGLFAWLLRQLGYKVTEYAARYLRGESGIPMRRHRVLKVEAEDGVWCCDVGIGEVCPRYPVRLAEGVEQPQLGECYRFDRDDFLGWVLMDLHKGEWRRFYLYRRAAAPAGLRRAVRLLREEPEVAVHQCRDVLSQNARRAHHARRTYLQGV